MPEPSWPPSPLGRVLHELQRHHGIPPPLPPSGPFEMILWEMVAYLADDARRAAAFTMLRERVSLSPAAILAAPEAVLLEVTRSGGAIAAKDRASRITHSARLVLEQCAGDLEAALRILPLPRALSLLKRFPMIGEPGAEKILMTMGLIHTLALESNGLRTLVRLGFGSEQGSYAATYRSTRQAVQSQLPATPQLLVRAHALLRLHGQRICLRSRPLCSACAVRDNCGFQLSAAVRPRRADDPAEA